MGFKTKAFGAACVVCAAISGFVFSSRSTGNLSEVHKDLQILADCAIKKTPVDFVVIDGLRTAQEHLINVANGRSWTKRSRHQDGLAIDFAAYVDGKITYKSKYYKPIADAFYACGEKHDIRITWGGEWRAQDLMHIELHRKDYP